MRAHSTYSAMLAPFLLLAAAPLAVLAGDVLETTGFSTCLANADVSVTKLNIKFDRTTKQVTFDVSGSSQKEQKIMATLVVNAYGKEVYRNTFDPCDDENRVDKLCPVPEGTFDAQGLQSIPAKYIAMIPDIAFAVPDLDSQATMQLTAIDSNEQLACITSNVGNGKTLKVAGVSYAAAGMAAAALGVSAMGAISAAGQAGAPSTSPSFVEVIGWFQTMALNGMMSANVPAVYQSWSKNFAFSTGLISWDGAQRSLDSFRNNTGGNLTEDSVDYLRNATLVHVGQTTVAKRGLQIAEIWARDSLSTGNGTNSTDGDNKVMHTVKGIQGFVEEYTIPNGNTFLTVLLVFAILIAAITVGILLFKVILETWALFGSFPRRLTNFRKRYWWILAKTITSLILVLYGIWTLYCVYQFKNGDSWAAKVLAGVTLGIFTGIIMLFTWQIWSIADKYKKMEGDTSALYDDKEVWRKYSIFYENYKKGYWWIFVPVIIYTFARGCVIAGADGHGMAQTAGQFVVESLLLALLIWARPFSLKSSNVINIIIQVVRVLSVVCILIFVEELGVAQTTKTVTGLVLVVMQAVLTGALAILIAVNAIVILCQQNPHRKKRKDAEKARDLDNLTPLDARNSLLMDPIDYKRSSIASKFGSRGYDPVPHSEHNTSYGGARPFHDAPDNGHLLAETASIARSHSHSRSISDGRSMDGRSISPQPRLPSLDFSTQPTGYTQETQWKSQGGHQGGYAY
ncbi:TRP-domain-containing protein [Massarina eburnea CBS 473.64]|uniref:TRP-domain-containing protein n=1 Tax=Massarina eburnea CBS 473.64 TaxID=1395130 RepID=A0A6A6S1T6_9PLEO|nr:TRP-domain-containing protein [Massarina eburnea CBS 473.64]